VPYRKKSDRRKGIEKEGDQQSREKKRDLVPERCQTKSTRSAATRKRRGENRMATSNGGVPVPHTKGKKVLPKDHAVPSRVFAKQPKQGKLMRERVSVFPWCSQSTEAEKRKNGGGGRVFKIGPGNHGNVKEAPKKHPHEDPCFR